MKKNNNAAYLDRVYSWGNKWNIFVMLVLLAFPFAVALIFKAISNWNGLFKGLIATAPMYWAVGVVEVITYIPMLGVGGSYLSFVTGNISNLKLPCALGALEQANVKADTEEGEVISTIAIAVSSIVTTVIIILGVLLIIPLQPILQSKILQPCFEQILPALFGGLGIVFISKNWKIAIAPIILMLILFIFTGLGAGDVGIMVPVGVLFTIAISRIMYKKGWI